MLRAALLVMAMAWIAGCSETSTPAPAVASAPAAEAAEQLLQDMEGIWRSSEPGQLVYLVRDGRNLRMLSGGVYETDVQLRSVDVKAQSVNLSVAAAGGRVVWTIRKVSVAGNEAPGYGLQVTMNGGEQLDLALVRRVSPEDREFMAGELVRLMREDEAVDQTAPESETDAVAAADAAEPVADDVAAALAADDAKVMKARGGAVADDVPAAEAPTYTTSYDCGKATKAAEATVCYDASLALLDQRLARGYRMALANADQPETLRSSQTRWLHDRRDACEDDAGCLRLVYRQRLKYFEGAPHYVHSEHAE